MSAAASAAQSFDESAASVSSYGSGEASALALRWGGFSYVQASGGAAASASERAGATAAAINNQGGFVIAYSANLGGLSYVLSFGGFNLVISMGGNQPD